jgi:capsule polysaccharide export protein KpsE/RkpR
MQIIEPQSEPDVLSNGHPEALPDQSADLIARSQLLWGRRRFLLNFVFKGLLSFTVLVFLIPAQYESVTQLMPPDNQGSSGMALISAFANRGDDMLGGYASDLLGAKTTGGMFVGVLHSRTVGDALINRFDLRKVYWIKRWEDARKKLESRTDISEDRKSGIISIHVRDRKPDRAQAMARAYVEELDRSVAMLSTSAARREREFLETRLKAVKQDLDQAANDFSQFASKNSAINIPEQGKAMLEGAARLQGELIAAEAESQGLQQIYTSNNVRVKAAQARITELHQQLDKLGGANIESNDQTAQAALYPSIRELPLLGVKYADLYRRTKIEEAVYEILTKQYEMAKVQEAKEIPSVRVLDAASYPERVASPRRIFLIFAGVLVSLAAGIAWVLGQSAWQEIDPRDPRKLFAHNVMDGLRSDWERLCELSAKLRQHER